MIKILLTFFSLVVVLLAFGQDGAELGSAPETADAENQLTLYGLTALGVAFLVVAFFVRRKEKQ